MDCGETIFAITPPAVFDATKQGRANANLLCGGSLQANEEDIGVHHGAGHEHANPTDDRGQQREDWPTAATARAMEVIIPA